MIYRNGQPFRELPVHQQPGKPSAELNTEIEVTGSSWYSLYAEGPYSELLDVRIPQAGTNAIRVYVGDQKIRSRESAEYFVRWIGQLKAMADKWPGWRSEAEREHVFKQFDQARKIYEGLAAEKQ